VPEDVATLLSPPRLGRRIAIVGASNARDKYGNIILRNLRSKGFTVLPVNPKEAEVEGETSYSALDQVPEPIHIVNFVVPPEISYSIVKVSDASRYGVLWFQPGSYDARVLAAAASFRYVIAGPCIMVEAKP
jgi:predicted CoA-binding protein